MNESQWRQIKINCEAGLVPSCEMVDAMIGEIERLRAEVERLTTPRSGFLTWLNELSDLLPVGMAMGVNVEELRRWFEAGMTVEGAAERINQEIR